MKAIILSAALSVLASVSYAGHGCAKFEIDGVKLGGCGSEASAQTQFQTAIEKFLASDNRTAVGDVSAAAEKLRELGYTGDDRAVIEAAVANGAL